MSDGTLAFFDGLPIIDMNAIPGLNRFLLRQLGEENVNDASKIYWPLDRHQMGLGIAVVRFGNDAEAQKAIDDLDDTVIDRHHTMHLERVEGSERFEGVRAHGVIDEGRLEGLRVLQMRRSLEEMASGQILQKD